MDKAEKIINVLFTGEGIEEWGSWHRKVIANITKEMGILERRQLLNEINYELSLIDVNLNTKEKQTLKRFIFLRGKLKKEQDEEIRILSKGF